MGFEDVEQTAPKINESGVDAASADIMEFLGAKPEPETEPDQANDAEDKGLEAQVESSEELGDAGEVEAAERPDEDSEQGEHIQSIDWAAKARVKVNGEEMEVTLNDLREGFQLKQDYTRSKQELVNERQQLQAQVSELQQLKAQEAQRLKEMSQQLEALIPQEPDWGSLAVENPQLYRQQKAAWDALQAQRQSVEEKRQRAEQEQQQTFQQQYQQWLQQEHQRLVQAVPDLQDQEKLKTFFNGIATYAQHNYGFSPQEIAQIGDHRLFVIADKARRWDELQSGTSGKQKTGADLPTLKPGASGKETPSSRKLREARNKLAKTGSVDAATDVILAGMG